MPHFTHLVPLTLSHKSHNNYKWRTTTTKKKTFKKTQRNKPSSVSKYINYKNWIKPYKRCAGKWERGVSSGSGEALVGSTQTGAVRESGHGRGTPGGGTGRSNWGTFFSLCFDLFPSSCLIFPPLPLFQLFQINVSIYYLFIWVTV